MSQHEQCQCIHLKPTNNREKKEIKKKTNVLIQNFIMPKKLCVFGIYVMQTQHQKENKIQ